MTTERCKTRKPSKFESLLARDARKISPPQGSTPIPEDRWVINFSKTQLCDAETEVLKTGLNFAPASVKIPIQVVIACREKGLTRLHEDAAADARRRIANILAKAKPPRSNLTPTQKKALKSLKQRDDIIILPTDKGRAMAIVDRIKGL